jgi:hypothetical protein
MSSLRKNYLRPLTSNWRTPEVAPLKPTNETALSAASLSRLRRFAPQPPPPPRIPTPSEPRCVVSIRFDQKRLMLPTGKKVLRKKGKHAGQIVDDVRLAILVIATATVSDGKREFFFRVTNKSRSIFDSRDSKRKPLADVRRELFRLCGSDSAADALGEFLA